MIAVRLRAPIAVAFVLTFGGRRPGEMEGRRLEFEFVGGWGLK